MWISGFQCGFLDFKVDFWISIGFSVRDFFRDGPLEPSGVLRAMALRAAHSFKNPCVIQLPPPPPPRKYLRHILLGLKPTS